MEIVAAAIGTGKIAISAIPVLLSYAGFTSTGVASGSIAAMTQASIGNVVAGSTFAALQSAGAAGLATSTTAAVGAVGAAGAAYLCSTGEICCAT